MTTEDKRTMPEDYDGGVEEMLRNATSQGGGEYPDLDPLAGESQEIRLAAGNTDKDAYPFSRPLGQIADLAFKPIGFARNGNLELPIERNALDGLLELGSLMLAAPCLNRTQRLEDADKEMKRWQDRASKTAIREDEPDMDALLDKWSEAHAFMLEARIYQDQHGIRAARDLMVTRKGEDGPEEVSLFDEFKRMRKQIIDAELEAGRMSHARRMVFEIQLHQYGIMAERQYDLEMKYATADYKELHQKQQGGAHIYDLVPLMPWPWQMAVRMVEVSMAGGVEHREVVTAMIASRMPTSYQPQPSYPYGQRPNGQEEDANGQPHDERPALFSWVNGNNGNKGNQNPRRRRRGRRRKDER